MTSSKYLFEIAFPFRHNHEKHDNFGDKYCENNSMNLKVMNSLQNYVTVCDVLWCR